MADRDEQVIASAVAFPEPEEVPPTPEVNQLKRRQSVTEDSPHGDPEETKRRRFSTDSTRHSVHSPIPPSTAAEDDSIHEDRRRSMRAERGHDRDRDHDRNERPAAAQADRPPRRRSGPGAAAEERKRGQRLFGALLGTLSQAPSSAAQRRRAEAEKRQAARLSIREGELDEAARANKEVLLAKRRREQVVLERQAMRLRHANMRAMARFLKTRTEPALYYKPWKMRPSQEKQIEDQIEEVEHIIEHEVEQFEQRHPQRPQNPAPTVTNDQNESRDTQEGTVAATGHGSADSTSQPAGADQQPNAPPLHDKPSDTVDLTTTSSVPAEDTSHADQHKDTSNHIPQDSRPHTEDTTMHDLSDLKAHEDEVMEEDKEDMVIY